jgi:uncharacterized protein (TIGR03437 family)
MFITGEGDVTPSLRTGGTPAAGTVSKLPGPRLPVIVTVGGIPADVSFAGIPPGLAGVTQINFRVPNVSAGAQPIIVTVGGTASAPATLSVTQ